MGVSYVNFKGVDIMQIVCTIPLSQPKSLLSYHLLNSSYILLPK